MTTVELDRAVGTGLRIRVRGVVQGVGFRPFVWRLAQQLGLHGSVRNDGDGVLIEAGGEAPALAELLTRLRSDAPAAARVSGVDSRPMGVAEGPDFRILPSRPGSVHTELPPDGAVCDDCLDEVFNPADRRHRYALLNCTRCGPRLSVTERLPYDRAHTSLWCFPMCAACAAEYADPRDRRFHAEPTACADCGPRLWAADAAGVELHGVDPLRQAAAWLQAGRIVALKGLGGFHLACNARNPAALQALRERKRRPEQPFAVMVANLASAARLAEIGAAQARLLTSLARPIVLLEPRPGVLEALPGLAPGGGLIGIMLAYTPLQWLLFHALRGEPAGPGWRDAAGDELLVMTSANLHGEPLVIDNGDALHNLAGITDGFVLHERTIQVRADDSLLRLRADGRPLLLRRARGFAPAAIDTGLPADSPAVLALGAQHKNTQALLAGGRATLSPHLGTLDSPAGQRALETSVDDLLRLTGGAPLCIAHDLHPDYASTRLAHRLAAQRGLRTLAVQHHHAHGAAVLAEHRHRGPALALALDGVGLGSDGTAWGGELLRLNGPDCQHLAHLATLALPGGDRAALEPWRMGAAVLHRLGRGGEIAQRFAGQPLAAALAGLLDSGHRCPPCSSLGRQFDAAAALLGGVPVQSFEAQAAQQLEALARRWIEDRGREPAGDAVAWSQQGAVISLDPLWQRLADGAGAPGELAWLFHDQVARALAAAAAVAAAGTGLRTVALAGGCIANTLLLDRLQRHLASAGLDVLVPELAPPNDGGLALGQAWVAALTPLEG